MSAPSPPVAVDRAALLRWAGRHRARAAEMRQKGNAAWAANNDEIAAHYEALAHDQPEAA